MVSREDGRGLGGGRRTADLRILERRRGEHLLDLCLMLSCKVGVEVGETLGEDGGAGVPEKTALLSRRERIE